MSASGPSGPLVLDILKQYVSSFTSSLKVGNGVCHDILSETCGPLLEFMEEH